MSRHLANTHESSQYAEVRYMVMFFSLSYSRSRCSFVSSEYLGIRRCVRNLRRTTSIVFGLIILHSSSSSTFARLPRLESLAVTTLIKLEFLNTTSHIVPLILMLSISASSSFEFGMSSRRILSITATPWLRTPDATQTLVSWSFLWIKHPASFPTTIVSLHQCCIRDSCI